MKEYDYRNAGVYFVTICTKDRKHILSTIKDDDIDNGVGATSGRPFSPRLTTVGTLVENAVKNISTHYPNAQIDDYVIMPNHVHLIITLQATQDGGPPMAAPTLGRIVNQFKGAVSKKAGKKIWQKSFYEHIIRDASDYDEKMKYLYENPLRWHYDELYTKS